MNELYYIRKTKFVPFFFVNLLRSRRRPNYGMSRGMTFARIIDTMLFTKAILHIILPH